MGITEQGLDFLVSARNAGVAYDRTMTIGRQALLVPPARVEAMLPETDIPADHDGFAEPVFERLGAREVCSLDASTFEGASHRHDLNEPIPPSLRSRFTAVIDGGALEHVFDFPAAMRNCMEMVEPGGHLLCMSPVNNAAGHGFYQVSPDLFFRLFVPDNGFTVERVLLAEVGPRAMWYRVVDPAQYGRRVEFTTKTQAYLYVQARRVGDGAVLARIPVQSDYEAEWRRWQDQPAAGNALSGERVRSAGALRTMARRYPAVVLLVRAARRAWARRPRRPQHLDPGAFVPIGRRLS